MPSRAISWPMRIECGRDPGVRRRSSGSPSSTARSRAAARCCLGPVESPNQASLVMFTIHAGRSASSTTSAGKDRLVADQRCDRRRPESRAGPGQVQRPWPRPGFEPAARHQTGMALRKPAPVDIPRTDQVPLVVALSIQPRRRPGQPRPGCCAGDRPRPKRTAPTRAAAPPRCLGYPPHEPQRRSAKKERAVQSPAKPLGGGLPLVP